VNKILAAAGNRITRLADRIGRRGSYLIFLALLDILYGYSILVQAGPLFKSVTLFLPDVVWGWIWIGIALICLQQAFVRLDRIGYIFATTIKFVWGTIMLYDWLTMPLDARGWVAAVIWYAFGILTAIVSNWPEHKQLRVGDFNDG